MREKPFQYLPRTPIQTEALSFAVGCMEKYMERAVVAQDHIATIRRLSEKPHSSPKMYDNFQQAMNAAVRAVDIEVRQYKRDKIFTPNEKWGV